MSDVNAQYALPFEAQFHAEQAQLEYIHRVLRNVRTARLVRVLAVHPYADGSGGTVDVQPLALDTDTNQQPLTEAPIYGMPWIRLQGGNSAFIVDPVVNDIGLANFADRDITNVVAMKGQAVVGSARAHSEMDGLYIGGVLNAKPTQWVKMSSAGIDIQSASALTMEAQSIAMTSQSTANITATTSVTLTGGGQTFVVNNSGATSSANLTAPDVTVARGSLNNHIHGGVTTGSGNTGNMTG